MTDVRIVGWRSFLAVSQYTAPSHILLRCPPWKRRDFSGSSHASDLNIGTPVATLPGAWRYRVSAGTGRPGVSIP